MPTARPATFSEVMTYKVEAFEASDADGDGYLSFEEMNDSALTDLESLR
jgi:Ca2+-binding EF-hand superfamily protein